MTTFGLFGERSFDHTLAAQQILDLQFPLRQALAQRLDALPGFLGHRQFVSERSRLRLSLVKLRMGLRQLGRQAGVVPADPGQLILFGSERLIQLPQFGLQVLGLLLMLALLLIGVASENGK